MPFLWSARERLARQSALTDGTVRQYCTYMARTERLEIRLSPEEKEAFELAARRHGLTVSDYLRACGHQDVFAEMPPELVKRLVRMNAQTIVDMLASGRAATFRAEEGR